MSDPAFDGYQCHGPMTAIHHPKYAQLLPSAWLCRECGVWRHAHPPSLDTLRFIVMVFMSDNLQVLMAEGCPCPRC